MSGCFKADEKSSCLRLAFNTRPTTLDPVRAADFASSSVVCMLYEGLTRCLPDGEIELALADWVEISNDQKCYTFHLRKAYWSDGKKITALDFEASWKSLLSPPQLSAPLLYPIKNAEKCVRGQVAPSEVGIYALDEETLLVELEQPTPYFYSLTAFPNFLPARDGAYSGPFVVAEDKASLKLVKNEMFWNKENIFLEGVEIHFIADESTALAMFERGELDFLGGPLSPLPLDAIENLKEELSFIPNAATTFCAFNTQSYPFNNLNLRKSLSLSIDRKEIVELVTQTGQIPASSFLPPQFTLHHEELSNASLAKELFAKALTELNTKSSELKITLYYRSGQLERRLAQILQEQWKNTLSLNVELVQNDPKTHAEKLQTRNFQICLTSWIAQFDDPLSILERFKDKHTSKNYSGWENEKYISLLNKAALGKDRELFLKKAEELFASEVPIAPIYHWRSPALTSSRLAKAETTPCGGILFERFRLTRRDP